MQVTANNANVLDTSNCGTTVLTIASTNAPILTTASTSVTSVTHININGASSSHLPESPPDSGSEPPYSPDDLNNISKLNNITNQQQQQQQLLQSTHRTHVQMQPHLHQHTDIEIPENTSNVFLASNLNCNICTSNHSAPNIINKSEDILLSSTAAVIDMDSNMGIHHSDVILQQSVSNWM